MSPKATRPRREEPPEDGPDVQPAPPAFTRELAVATALIAAAGALGWFVARGALGDDHLARLAAVLREEGVALPWVMEAAIAVRHDLACLGVGLVGAIAVPLAARSSPRLAWGAAAVGLSVALACLTASLGLHLIYRLILDDVFHHAWSVPAREPGRTAEVAARAVEALRASLARGTGVLTTPQGQRREFLRFTPPGAVAPAEPLPDLSRLRAAAAFLLPWGPRDRGGGEAELFLPLPGLVSPGDLDAAEVRGAPPWRFDLAETATTEDGARVPRVPAVIDVEGAPGYSFAFMVRRARLDDVPGGEHPLDLGSELIEDTTGVGAEDSRSDDLLQVRVMVFQGFAPAAASADPIPRSNCPVRELVTLVAR